MIIYLPTANADSDFSAYASIFLRKTVRAAAFGKMKSLVCKDEAFFILKKY